MELRHYIDVLKRHRWLMVEGVVLVGLIAALVSGLQTPTFKSSARVLLRPNDSSEQLYPNGQVSLFNDPDRYVAAQMDIIQSEAVAQDAAKNLGGADSGVLLNHVSVSQSGTTDVLEIAGTDVDPARSRDIANAFAKSYIENRRQFAVGALKKASDEVQGKLDELQARIAQLDAQIGDGGLQPGATATVSGPTSPAITGPTSPAIAGPTGSGLDQGAQPTTREGLKAARYAAAVQYESLYSRQQELQVDMSLKRGEAELIAEAKTPSAPVSPKPMRNGILGGIVGLLLAVGVSFLHEQLDDRIRSREDLERATGLAVIAELPVDRDAAKRPNVLAAADRPRGQLAEAVRGLRTSIEFLGLEEPVRRLVVTSPGPGDGKSLVAANLAVAYAQAGNRTVLVSADLRKPRIEAIVGIAGPVAGLSDVIARAGAAPAVGSNGHGHGRAIGNGRAARAAANGGGLALDIAEVDTAAMVTPAQARQRRAAVTAALRPTRVPNLMVMPAGSTPPNPVELLGSRRAEQVLDDLSRIADVVVIDTPPVLAVSDAAILAGKSDGVVLVSSLRQTHRGGAQRAKETLEGSHVRLLGAILNRVGGAEYGYGYGGYYGEAPAPAATRRDAKPSRQDRRRAKADTSAARTETGAR